MLSQAKQKWIRSLEQKKNRAESGLFLAEGNKCCSDLLELLPCKYLAATSDWLNTKSAHSAQEIDVASKEEIRKASLQKNPQEVLAVFEIPKHQLRAEDLRGKLTLALDNVQDPGNVGTIIRLADWFGIHDVLCSIGTVDAFNPKTVQASMGAIGRVRIHYLDLHAFLVDIQLPVYGTFLEGEDLYDAPISNEGILIMGNEGKGISDSVKKHIQQKLYIPDFPVGKTGSESLNVGVATAIICAEFRRRTRL
jgi:RNA methyltransferase, TrmH family